MFIANLKSIIILLLLVILAVGCAHVNYVGKTFVPGTEEVDVYFSKEEIKKDYTIIGHAIGSGKLVSNNKIREKLIDKAKENGADAILITEVDRTHVPAKDGSITEKQIKASFLKYY
jgi:hypothetical protein